MDRFHVVLADPPWLFKNRGNRMSPDYAGEYETSPIAPILAMGPTIMEAAADDALLFLWCPNALVLEGAATEVCRAWGFAPKQLVPWLKTCVDGETPRIGGGNYTRACTEMLVVASRGHGSRLVKNRGVPGVLLDPIIAPRTVHSAKPDESYRMIEQLVPEGPCLELFGRRKYSDRWIVLGDQAPDVDGRVRLI